MIVVAAMKANYAAADSLILAVPPEGTRDAGAEMEIGLLSHRSRRRRADHLCGHGLCDEKRQPARHLLADGDYAADLPIIQGFYADAKGKFPDQFVMTGK